MRKTQRRMPTMREMAQTQLIAEALWEWHDRGHGGLGIAQLARRICLPIRTLSQKRTAQRKIEDLMPFVVHEVATSHPGFTVHHPPGGLITITQDHDTARSIGLTRLFMVDTKLRRARDELQVLLSSTDPNDQDLALRARMLVLSLDDMGRIVDERRMQMEAAIEAREAEKVLA